MIFSIRASFMTTLCILLLLCSPRVLSQDVLITEDTLWSNGLDPLVINGNVTISGGATLYIYETSVQDVHTVSVLDGALVIHNSVIQCEILEWTSPIVMMESGVLEVHGARRAPERKARTVEFRGAGLSVAWVDFLSAGPGNGSQAEPFNTLGEALAVVFFGGTIFIVTGRSDENDFVISRDVILEFAGFGPPPNFLGGMIGDDGSGGSVLKVELTGAGAALSTADVSVRLGGVGPPRRAIYDPLCLCFRAAGLSAGPNEVLAVVDGYEVAVEDVIVQELGAALASIDLAPSASSGSIVVSIPIPATNTSLFTESVTASDQFSSFTKTSSEIRDGSFVIDELPASTYDITAKSSKEYTVGAMTVSLASGEEKSATLSASGGLTPANIQGTVTDAAVTPPGDGIVGAKVIATPQGNTVSFFVESSTDGIFFLPDVVVNGATTVAIVAESPDRSTVSNLSSESIGPGSELTDINLVIDFTQDLDPARVLRESFESLADFETEDGLLSFNEAKVQIPSLDLATFDSLDTIVDDDLLSLAELVENSIGTSGFATPVYIQFPSAPPLSLEPEIGTKERPFDTLAEGIVFVKEGGKLLLYPSSTGILSTPVMLSKAVRLEKVEGTVGNVIIGN